MKYEYLEQLKNNFIDALQEETKNATNESDIVELTTLVEDAICKMPIELIQKDYWTRKAIKHRLPEEKQNDKNFINGLMKYIYNQDAIYIGDYVVDNIQECIEEYTEQQTK